MKPQNWHLCFSQRALWVLLVGWLVLNLFFGTFLQSAIHKAVQLTVHEKNFILILENENLEDLRSHWWTCICSRVIRLLGWIAKQLSKKYLQSRAETIAGSSEEQDLQTCMNIHVILSPTVRQILLNHLFLYEKRNGLKLFFVEHFIQDHTELPNGSRASRVSTIVGVLWRYMLRCSYSTAQSGETLLG